ncbi:La- protein 7 [Quaeritorhiza haematococci]|nr:La- protein 7 [Quaeritorhiza haematococci]
MTEFAPRSGLCGGVRTSLFTSRLRDLTDDDAVIAKAVRFYAKELEMSEDGKSVRRRNPLPDWTEVNNRTLYAERLPNTSTPESIETLIENALTATSPTSPSVHIENVHIPYPMHLGRTNLQKTGDVQGGEGGSGSGAGPEGKKRFPGYAFVTFATVEDMKVAMKAIRKQYVPLKPDNVEQVIRDGLEGNVRVRAMSKNEWIKRTDEYRALLNRRYEELDAAMKSSIGGHESAEYQKGVVAQYTGVHKQTSRKILKKLFDIVAPVAYVDHPRGQTSGHVRFKSPHSAQLALTYFNQETIHQKHKDDIGSLLVLTKKKKKAANLRKSVTGDGVDSPERSRTSTQAGGEVWEEYLGEEIPQKKTGEKGKGKQARSGGDRAENGEGGQASKASQVGEEEVQNEDGGEGHEGEASEDEDVQMTENVIRLRLLEGEEEEFYWSKISTRQTFKKQTNNRRNQQHDVSQLEHHPQEHTGYFKYLGGTVAPPVGFGVGLNRVGATTTSGVVGSESQKGKHVRFSDDEEDGEQGVTGGRGRVDEGGASEEMNVDDTETSGGVKRVDGGVGGGIVKRKQHIRFDEDESEEGVDDSGKKEKEDRAEDSEGNVVDMDKMEMKKKKRKQ